MRQRLGGNASDGNRPPKITHLDLDDWSGVYVDDELVFEGHSIPDWFWLDLLKKHAGVETAMIEGDYEWASDLGSCPESLSDVVGAKP